jgi:uncharacterized protein YndB with AHSA1/START domain
MFKKIGIGLAVVLGVFAVVVSTRPDTFRVERVTSVAAPAELAFAQVNDFHKWAAWSPWQKLDPTMKLTFAGGPGVGADYRWEGNDKVGQGEMIIKESTAPSKVVIGLTFVKPFQSESLTTFSFTPGASATQVSWVMEGRNNFISKAMGLFMSMDKMIGKDFEEGLANLKGVAETEAQKAKAAAEAAKQAAAAQAAAPVPAAAAPAKKN